MTDRTLEFLLVCAQASAGRQPARPLLALPGIGSNRGIILPSRALARAIRRVETHLLSGNQDQPAAEAASFIGKAGHEIAQLERLAQRFSASQSGSVHRQLALVQGGLVVVLYTRIKRLSVLVSRGSARRCTPAPADSADSICLRSEGFAARFEESVRIRTQLPEATSAPRQQLQTLEAIKGGSSAAVSSERGQELRVGAAAPVATPRPGPEGAAAGAGAAVSLESRQLPTRQQLEQVQQLQQEALGATSDAAALERQMRDVSAMVELVATKLLEQSAEVGAVLDSAVTSTRNIRAGNRELVQAADRPSYLRDAVVALLLGMAAVLLLLDWLSRP